MSKRANSTSIRLNYRKNWENNELIYTNFSEQFINDLFIRNLLKNILIKNKILISKIFISQNLNLININIEILMEPLKLIKFFYYFSKKDIKFNYLINSFFFKKKFIKNNIIFNKTKLNYIKHIQKNNLNFIKFKNVFFIKPYKKNIFIYKKNKNILKKKHYNLKNLYYKWKYIYINQKFIQINNHKLYNILKYNKKIQLNINLTKFWKKKDLFLKKYINFKLRNKLEKKYFYQITIIYFKNILKKYILKEYKKKNIKLTKNIFINIKNIYSKLNSKKLKIKLNKNFIKFFKLYKYKLRLTKNRTQNQQLLKYFFSILSFSLILKNPELINNLLIHFLSKSKQNQRKILIIFTQLFKFFKICNFNNLEGIKLIIKGRINNSSRTQKFQFITGKIPLETFKNKIYYSKSAVKTKYGSLGIHLWLHYI